MTPAACCGQVVDAIDGHAAKRTKAAKSTLTYWVQFAMKSNSTWWLHAEHVARFEATVSHAAQIQQYIENFEGKDFQDAVEEALFLLQVVKSMPVFLAECKKKVHGDFQLKFERQLLEVYFGERCENSPVHDDFEL